MTAVADSASVRIVIADYVAADSSGKVTIVGGGVAVLGRQVINPSAGAGSVPPSTPTAPFGIFAVVSFGPELIGRRVKIELTLRRADDSIVEIPMAADGDPPVLRYEPIRVAHDARLEPASIDPKYKVPAGIMHSKVQWVLNFPTGLTLEPGRYFWRLKIDGHGRDDWTEEFYASP